MRSSSSRTASSPVCVTETATSVGARSSFAAASGPAASLRRASAFGPTTRKRHGFVRLWFGAQRASSNSSSRVARSTGSGPYALWVRRPRVAAVRVADVAVELEPVGRLDRGGHERPPVPRAVRIPDDVAGIAQLLALGVDPQARGEELLLQALHPAAVRQHV